MVGERYKKCKSSSLAVLGAAGSHTDKQASNAKNRKQNRSRLEGKNPLSLREPSLPSQGPLLAEPRVSAGEELWLSESQAENGRSGA